MKKIDLSKETLRELTPRETEEVAGGAPTQCECPPTYQRGCPIGPTLPVS